MKVLLYILFARKTLVKLTAGVNFTNVLPAAFTSVHRSQKRKKDTDDLTVIFALFGPTDVNAACKMLTKLTPGPGPCPTPSCQGNKIKFTSVLSNQRPYF